MRIIIILLLVFCVSPVFAQESEKIESIQFDIKSHSESSNQMGFWSIYIGLTGIGFALFVAHIANKRTMNRMNAFNYSDRINQALNNKDYSFAVRLCDRFIELDFEKDKFWPLSEKAYALYHMQQYDSAISTARQALAYRPNSISVLNTICVSRIGSGDWEGAYETCLEILELDDNYPETLDHLGSVFFELFDDFDTALFCYNEVINNPNSHTVHILSSMLNMIKMNVLRIEQGRIQNHNQAVQLCNDVLTMQSRNIEALVLKGRVLFSQQNFQEALDCFDEALSLESISEQARWGRINTLFQRSVNEPGLRETALEELNQLLTRVPGSRQAQNLLQHIQNNDRNNLTIGFFTGS